MSPRDVIGVPTSFPPRFRQWPGETVLFDRNSGSTHLLSGPAGVLLELVAKKPRLRSEVTTAITIALDLSEEDAGKFVDETILALAALGILDVVDACE